MRRFEFIPCLLPLGFLLGCGRWIETESAAKEPKPAAAADDRSPDEPASCRAHSLSPAEVSPSGDARRVLTTARAAYRTKLAVIANNLANAETPGFKRSRGAAAE